MLVTMRRLKTIAGVCASITFSWLFSWFVAEKMIERQIYSEAQLHGFPQISIGSIKPAYGGFKISNLELANQETGEKVQIGLLRFRVSFSSFLNRQFETVTVSGLKIKTSPQHLRSYLFNYFDQSIDVEPSVRHLTVKGDSDVVFGEDAFKIPLTLNYDCDDKGEVNLIIGTEINDEKCSGKAQFHIKHQGVQLAAFLSFDDIKFQLYGNRWHIPHWKLSLEPVPQTFDSGADRLQMNFMMDSDPVTHNDQYFSKPSFKAVLGWEKGVIKAKGSGKIDLFNRHINLNFGIQDNALVFSAVGKSLSSEVFKIFNSVEKKEEQEKSHGKVPSRSMDHAGNVDFSLKTEFPFDPSDFTFENLSYEFLCKIAEIIMNSDKKGSLSLKIKGIDVKDGDFVIKNMNSDMDFKLFPLKSVKNAQVNADFMKFADYQIKKLKFDFLYDQFLHPTSLSFGMIKNGRSQGEFKCHDFKYEKDNSESTFLLDAETVGGQDVVEFFGVGKNIKLEGLFTGHAQCMMGHDKIRILNAKIFSSSSKGRLQCHALKMAQPMQLIANKVSDEVKDNSAELATTMLENLYFSLLTVECRADGDHLNFHSDVTGYNPSIFRGHPFRFQIKAQTESPHLPNPLGKMLGS